MGNVIIVKADGTYEVKALEKPSLQMMYRELDCDTVDVIALRADIDMWISDSYGVQEEPTNLAATMFSIAVGPGIAPVKGTVMLAKHDKQGATIGLTLRDQRILSRLIEKVVNDLKAASN